MNFKNLFIGIAGLAILILLAYLVNITHVKNTDYISLSGFTQGTTYHITYKSNKGADYQAAIDSLLNQFDKSLSIYNPNSIISRFNNNVKGTIADDWFIRVFNKSHEVYLNTDGAFDITVGPIVNALGFGSSDTLNVDSTLIKSLLKFVGMNKVRINGNELIKENDNIILDVNAIAQGYSVDIVSEFMEKMRIKNYLIEIGGEIRVKGKNSKNNLWQIGIDKPVEGNDITERKLQTILKLDDKSLATSGNYRKFYVKNGIKYVHTINPKTGYPVISNLLSATVIADDCMTADAYATALMVMGLEKSKEFLAGNTFLDVYLIYADDEGNFQVYKTPGFNKFLAE